MLRSVETLERTMQSVERPEIELLKTFEAPIGAIPERPVEPPRDLPLDELLQVAEEAYRALDA